MPSVKDHRYTENISNLDTSIICTAPFSRTGDMLLAVLFTDNQNVTWSSPNWNLISDITLPSGKITLMYKISAGSIYEYTFIFSEPCKTQATIISLEDTEVNAYDVARAMGGRIIDAGYTHDDLMRLMASVLLGKVNGAGTGEEKFRDLCDTRDRVVVNVDCAGNRDHILYDPTPCGDGESCTLPPVGGDCCVDGGIFITDVEPADGGFVGGKVFSSNGMVLESFSTDTNDVIAHIMALPGHTNYIPNATVNGVQVPLYASVDKPIFYGSVRIDITGKIKIVALHEDGACDTAIIYVHNDYVDVDYVDVDYVETILI